MPVRRGAGNENIFTHGNSEVTAQSWLYTLRFISFSTEEFAATIAVDGIAVLREPAGDGRLSSFTFLDRKYFNKDIINLLESRELQ